MTPMKVYALDGVRDDPTCLARMERMLNALGIEPGDVVWFGRENAADVVGEVQELWPPETVPEGRVRTFMRPLVFTKIDLSFRRPDLAPLLERCPEKTPVDVLRKMFGHMVTAIDQHPHERDQHDNCVCWPTYNFGTMTGCPHGCQYCGAGRTGKFIGIALNLEEYMQKVAGPVVEANPWNKVFRMILSGSDHIAFEPEYGVHELFAAKLSEYEGRYGLIHTASSNVDWLVDLPNRDKLIILWSTTCEAVARDIEPGTGRAIDRIEAARKCQELGLPVRFKFKPVIPVRNWREEYAWIIEQALKQCEPESMGFCLYIWNTYDSLVKSIDPELLDAECLSAARDAVEEMKGSRNGPFPHRVRKGVYRFLIGEARRWNKDVPLYISTETRQMWDELKDELGQDPSCYVCGCSSVALPGRKLGLSPAFRYSTYHPTPL